MPQMMSQPIAKVTPNVQSGEVGYRVSALPFEFSGGKVRLREIATIYKSINSGVIAAGASFTVWTPAAGFTIRLEGVSILSTGSGSFELYVGARLIGTFFNGATIHTLIPIPALGLVPGVHDEALSIKNITAGNNGYLGAAYGSEIS